MIQQKWKTRIRLCFRSIDPWQILLRPKKKENRPLIMGWREYIITSYETGRLSSQGSSFSWTKSGLSSWGQCPTPSNIYRLTEGSRAGKDEKYFPTGPSIGVNGSSSPHKSKTGKLIFGINSTGFGPGGPVIIETKASRAPSSSAGLLIICNVGNKATCSVQTSNFSSFLYRNSLNMNKCKEFSTSTRSSSTFSLFP